jgi:hypothetical protein
LLACAIVGACSRDSHAPVVLEIAPIVAPPGERVDEISRIDESIPAWRGARIDDSIAAIRRGNEAEAMPVARAVEHRVTCGGVTAIWTGENDGDFDRWTKLELAIVPAPEPAIDGHTRVVTRDLADHDEVAFDIFSPDCRRVLLLQSRYGPFHVVRTHELAAYLEGAPPERVLRGTPDPAGITGTGVFRGGGWISNTEVAFTWGCCDPPITTRVVLPALH